MRIARLMCVLALLAVVSIEAHPLPPLVEVYLKVDAATLRVLARLPLATLADARLPLSTAGSLDLIAARPVVDAAVADFAKGLAVMDGERSLAAPTVSWVIAVPQDASFATYEAAAAHILDSPLSPDKPVDANKGFLDLSLSYALASPAPRLSARVNSLRAGGSFVPTSLTYLTSDGDVRRFVASGAPHRVAFEPAWIDTAATFARRGVDRLLSSPALLMFLFCLAIPRRQSSSMLRMVGIVVAGYVVSGLMTALIPADPAVAFTTFCATVASAMLVAVAVQNIMAARRSWVEAVCLVFGIASGVGAGVAARASLALAGSHALEGLALFLGVTVVAAFAVVPALVVVIAWCSRLPLPPPVLTVLLSLPPLHTALHEVTVEGEALGASASGGGIWTEVVAHWPLVVGVLALLLIAAFYKMSARTMRPEAG